MLNHTARKIAKVATLATRPGTAGEGEAATSTLWGLARKAVLVHGWAGAEVVWESTEILPAGVRGALWDRVCDLHSMMDRIDSIMATLGEDEEVITPYLWADLTY